MRAEATETSFAVSGDRRVSALLLEPEDARCLLVFAHGAGAGMRHATIETFARGVARLGIATLRFQFPYAEKGRRRPDPPAVLQGTVRAAVAHAKSLRPHLPLLAGGRSMGGRMASGADAVEALDVAGLVFHAFPLHPPGKPGASRADHLEQVSKPMLFLNGARDRLADPALLAGVCDRLGPRATLHRVEGGDHSLQVPKRSGRKQEDVDGEVAEAVSRWRREVLGLQVVLDSGGAVSASRFEDEPRAFQAKHLTWRHALDSETDAHVRDLDLAGRARRHFVRHHRVTTCPGLSHQVQVVVGPL